MKNKIMIIFCILLLFLPAVAAEVGAQLGEPYVNVDSFSDIRFKAHPDYYDICSMDETIIPVVVRNNNDFTDMFTFSVNKDYASLPTTNAIIGEGKRAILPLILNPPLDMEENTTLMLDIVTKNEGLKRSVVLKTNVKRCYDFNLTIDRENEEICGCDEAVYSVMISNEGVSSDSFSITLDAPGWVDANITDPVRLFDGQSEELVLAARPGCEEKGVFNIGVEAVSEQSDVVLRDSIVVDVVPQKQCYNTVIDVDNVNIDYFGKNIPIVLKNKGSKEMSYFLTADGVSWYSLSQTNFSVDPKGEKTVNLALHPGEDVVEGEYTVDVKAYGAGQEFTESIVVKLRKEPGDLGKMGFYINYFRYYIILGFVLLVIILFLVVMIRKRLEERPKAEKKVKEERRVEKKIEKKTETKAEEKKEVKKVGEKKVRKLKFFEYIYLILVVLLFLSAIIYPIYRFYQGDYDFIGLAKDYLWYIIIGVVVLVLFILVVIFMKGKGKRKKTTKKAKIKNTSKKVSKKAKKLVRNMGVIVLGLIILSGIIYSFVYFNLSNHIKEFLVVYYPYVLMGVGLLVILILILNFHSKKIS